jgi:hypothetical protein
MHYDALEDEDNHDKDGYDDETSDDQDELEDDEDIIKSPFTHDQPEKIVLPLPSHLGFNQQQDETITGLVEDEMALRQSQA